MKSAPSTERQAGRGAARPTTRFRDRQAFRSPQPYRLLPFRFERFNADEVLLVNDVGEHLFLPQADFDRFVQHRLSTESDAYLDLKGKHFLFDGVVPAQLLALQYRTRKAHLAGFTKLHIFVVTLRCEHSCAYCQVSRVTQDRARFDMSAETASRLSSSPFARRLVRSRSSFKAASRFSISSASSRS